MPHPHKNKRQATKQAASLALNNFAEHTSCKNLENDLRDKILDFEDQIFIGSLGKSNSLGIYWFIGSLGIILL